VVVALVTASAAGAAPGAAVPPFGVAEVTASPAGAVPCASLPASVVALVVASELAVPCPGTVLFTNSIET